jgi:hypothetical protein
MMSLTNGNEREMRSPKSLQHVLKISMISLTLDAMLTPGNTPLPKTVDIDLPLLAHRYAPISVAGDGAFSCTILAYDTLHPQNPVVAIKAMKPSFEIIGQRVQKLNDLANCRNTIFYDELGISRCLNTHPYQ